jgi:hypothetical protein
MTKGIRLHKEFGLNPTISTCIVCGEDKKEIALLGAGYKGQAPMHMITSVEPCDNCRKKYLEEGDGVLLLEATSDRKPTGSLTVLKREAFERLFNTPVPHHRIALIDAHAYQLLQAMRPKPQEVNECP